MQKRICKRKQLQFDILKWCKRLGQKCQVCQLKITHEKCISLCKCYYFCHQKCFVSSFQPLLRDEQTDIKCSQCKQALRLNLKTEYKYSPSYTILKACKVAIVSLLLILAIVGLGLTLSKQLTSDLMFFMLYVEGLVVCLLLYMEVIYLRDILYIKIVKIKEIISNRLDIQTSAFKQLELYTNQELIKENLTPQIKATTFVDE